jgi:hypothetical protein
VVFIPTLNDVFVARQTSHLCKKSMIQETRSCLIYAFMSLDNAQRTLLLTVRHQRDRAAPLLRLTDNPIRAG